MLKNKIKNKLQKLCTRGPDVPSLTPDTLQPSSSLPERVKSSRRSKLSLSKDLSINSQNSSEHNHPLKTENSLSASKKAYIRVVSSSGRKDLLALSNSKICLTAHGNNSERTQFCTNHNRQQKSMFQDGQKVEKGYGKSKGSFDAMGLKEMAMNLAKSAAILNDRIVPVLLQAATISHKIPQQISEDQLVSLFLGSTTNLQKQQEEQRLMQTPINHLKHRTFQEKSTQLVRKNTGMRCETEPSNSGLKKYKNRHKIQHSPAPIKNKSPRGSFCTPTYVKRHQQTHNNNQQEETKRLIVVQCKIDPILNPLGRKLQMINFQRKLVEGRIAKKLDELSNKATSIVKQYTINEAGLAESHSKIPKLLLNSNKSKAVMKASTSRKENCKAVQQGQQNSPHIASSSKEQLLRNMIMNRIFS